MSGYAAGRRRSRAGTHLRMQVRNKPVHASGRVSQALGRLPYRATPAILHLTKPRRHGLEPMKLLNHNC
jgi:hypothetical protein